MLRASSGKHARFVGVLAAGGDSIPRIRGSADSADLAFFGGFLYWKMRLNLPQDDLKSIISFGDCVAQTRSKVELLKLRWDPGRLFQRYLRVAGPS